MNPITFNLLMGLVLGCIIGGLIFDLYIKERG